MDPEQFSPTLPKEGASVSTHHKTGAKYCTGELGRQFLKSCRILCTTFVVCSRLRLSIKESQRNEPSRISSLLHPRKSMADDRCQPKGPAVWNESYVRNCQVVAIRDIA